MSTEETYIPRARDAVIAYADARAARMGYHHCRCVRCHDADPWDASERVYGDLHDDSGEACRSCGVTMRSLSEQCQVEHDEQQARWARADTSHILIEYGVATIARCRIY